MSFVGRADDLIDFGVTRLTEKVIWQAIENSGVPYVDWVACKEVGENMALHVFIEPKDGYQASESDVADAIYNQILSSDDAEHTAALIRNDFTNVIKFVVKVTLLSHGAFANYTAQKRAEGSELAHLKPPHINPSEKVFSILLAEPEKVRVGLSVRAKSG